MGDLITMVLAVLVVGYGGYTLFKALKKDASGKGACACSTADCANCPSRSKH